ncbi:hypothetical protein GCM10022267_36220 [Lentzea roselyniae]|uniref:Carbohydrate binding module (Family 6) n=1 Tax=Lentzea roselyniae TaxID=531940 RepID=A0ABP7B1I9_9PSEU
MPCRSACRAEDIPVAEPDAAVVRVRDRLGGSRRRGDRFANGTTSARPASLIVNGSAVQTPSFEGTGAWNAWAVKTFTVSLNAGSNTIRFSPATSAGLPNVGHLEVISA